MTPEALVASLRWRYATKKFDPAGKIPVEKWEALKQSLVLAPSSYGLQPWRFFVVEDKALRAKLKDASWGQSQIVDADKLVVFAVRRDFGAADVERHVARVAQVRGASPESLASFRQMMLGSIKAKAPEALQSWASRQVYIALGTFLAGAAILGVDACPMEGIEPSKYDEILGLGKKGYQALCVATAGVRSPQDDYARQPKVRYEAAEVVESV